QYRYHRVYAPITAALSFSGRQANLEFIDPLKRASVELNRRVFPLAADFSASTALLIVRERPERLRPSRVVHPEGYCDSTNRLAVAAVRPREDACDFCSRLAGNGCELGANDRHPSQGSVDQRTLSILVLQLSEWLSLSILRGNFSPKSRWNRSRIPKSQARDSY